MQKGPILMEPITNQGTPESGLSFLRGSRNRHPFFRSFRRPGFRFPRGHIGCTQPFCSCRRAHQLRVPRPSDTGCAAIPPLSLCRIRKRHFNDCRRRCAGAGILPACTGGSHASSGSDRIPVFHDAYPFLLPLFLSVHRVFFGISSVFVCGRPHFSCEPNRGG